MTGQNYMQDETVRRYYDDWIDKPTALSGHFTDERRFYKFVKACVNFAKGQDLRRVLDISLLRLSLYDSLHDEYEEDVRINITHDIIARFEELRDYEATPFP